MPLLPYCIILGVVIEFWKFLEFYKTTTEDNIMSHTFKQGTTEVSAQAFKDLPDDDKDHIGYCSECTTKLSEAAKIELRTWRNGGRSPNQPDAI